MTQPDLFGKFKPPQTLQIRIQQDGDGMAESCVLEFKIEFHRPKQAEYYIYGMNDVEVGGIEQIVWDVVQHWRKRDRSRMALAIEHAVAKVREQYSS